jgi:hypothetical protein
LPSNALIDQEQQNDWWDELAIVKWTKSKILKYKFKRFSKCSKPSKKLPCSLWAVDLILTSLFTRIGMDNGWAYIIIVIASRMGGAHRTLNGAINGIYILSIA